MKIGELSEPAASPDGDLAQSKTAAPVSPGESVAPELALAEASAPQEPQYTTEITPSGIEILYQWAPKRLYRLNGTEAPSVTTVLGVLDKSGPLTWWGQGVGVAGVQELERKEALPKGWWNAETKDLVDLLTEHKLTVNHVKDKAADRGVNVHAALERWCETGEWASPSDFEKHEWGYVEGLLKFLAAVQDAAKVDGMELMVGSLQHQYAGRFDLVLTLSKPVEVVTKTYPKKTDKVEEIPAGRYLLDLKTSKRVYDTHYLQLEAYEKAAVECGYQPTDCRGVVHVTEDGRYELVVNKDWTFDDFLAVRKCYQVINERGVIQALRDELDANEVAA